MSTPRGAAATPAHMLDSLAARRLDDVIDCFDGAPDTYVFLEGPRWTNTGGDRIHEGWRKYFEAPIRLAEWAWVEGPVVQEADRLALVCGVIDFVFETDGRRRDMRMRMTWVLRPGPDGVWRIVHEHGSQPLADPYGTGDWAPEQASA